MYECPNCGGNLKFDIASQQLFCAYCDTHVDPYSINKEQDAEETKEYEVTMFTCPQCGGQILSEDTTAATFCSFCGSATILNSRISKSKKPDIIIPFQKTEEDCKKAYAKMMRRAIFAPKELKDKEHIEKFRGIYMPYWLYSFENKREVRMRGKKSRRWGDYIHVKHYDLRSEVDASYENITYDASASFSDNLSSAIGPFDLDREKVFTPTYLSGFYADTSDVGEGVYYYDAARMAANDGVAHMEKCSAYSKYHVSGEDMRDALEPRSTGVKQAMFPVWFLSYKNKDRVAYAVINGQTGRAAADLPVDLKKYIIGSLLLAVPLFLLFNMFLTLKPTTALVVAALLALLSGIISDRQLSKILKKESGMDDKGLLHKQNIMRANHAWEYPPSGERRSSTHDSSMMKIILIPVISTIWPIFLVLELIRGGKGILSMAVLVIIVIVTINFSKSGGSRRQTRLKGSFKERFPVLVKPVAAIILALLILFINPVMDIYYYAGAIIAMGMVIWNFADILKRFNLLTTRKLPQLNKRGGDDIA